MRLLFLWTLLPAVLLAQTKPVHRCHVYAVDEAGAEKLMKAMQDAPPGTDMAKFREAASKIELILGRFEPEVGEEVDTVKAYPLGDTGMTVTAEVVYTDESMRGEDSMILSLAVAKEAVPRPRRHLGAVLAEVNFDEFTYIARVKQRHAIGGKIWYIGLECQCTTDEERRRLWEAFGAKPKP